MESTPELNHVLTAAAVIVALLAMLATFWQAALTRKHNRLSVQPLLSFDAVLDCRNDGTNLIVRLQNHGFGPAVILDRYILARGMRVRPNGPLKCEVSELLTDFCWERFEYKSGDAALPPVGSIIRIGSSTDLINHHFVDVGPKAFLRALYEYGMFEIVVVYRSIYNEKQEIRYSPLEIRDDEA